MIPLLLTAHKSNEKVLICFGTNTTAHTATGGSCVCSVPGGSDYTLVNETPKEIYAELMETIDKGFDLEAKNPDPR